MPGKPPPKLASAQSLYRTAVEALSAGRFEESIALLKQVQAIVPPASEIHNNLGTAYWKAGRLEQAEEQYAKAVRLSPQNALALNNYGALLMQQSQLDRAEKFLKRAYALKPDHYSVSNNMGLLQCWRGDFAAAEKSFLAAIAARPSWSEAQGNLGNVYRDTLRPKAAEAAYRRAIELDEGNAAAWSDLGSLYVELQRNAEAETALRRSLTLQPAGEKAFSVLLQLLEMTNRLEEAAAILPQAKAQFPASPPIVAAEAKVLRRAGKTAEARAEMEKLLPQVPAQAPEGIPFFFELGQIYDEAAETDKAFACFEKANAAQAATPKAQALNKRAHTTIAARIIRDLTPELAKAFPAAPADDSPSPVFLVGFPRSGTTLLDQILSSHPGIYVSEEKPAVTLMAEYFIRNYGATAKDSGSRSGIDAWEDAAYPAAIPRLQPQDITEMRRIFFSGHGGIPAGGRLLVDKMPVNLMHAGFIKAVFPQAKFILAQRHPCDCVLSCYMQAFALNPAMARFLDLKDSARFYDEMFSVWEHTARVLSLGAHAIRYEDVVGDFRPAVASLLLYLGVDWNDAVLEYDKTARAKERINTPSYRQVTQKIYTRARGRWRRYEKHMRPVLDILAPHAARYGYPMGNDE